MLTFQAFLDGMWPNSVIATCNSGHVDQVSWKLGNTACHGRNRACKRMMSVP
jgi:hypothetical protein